MITYFCKFIGAEIGKGTPKQSSSYTFKSDKELTPSQVRNHVNDKYLGVQGLTYDTERVDYS